MVTKTVGNLGTSTFQYDITKDLGEGQYAEISKDVKGNVTQKIFDKVGRLAEVRDGDQTTGTKYEYNPNGSTKSVTYPDGSHEDYTYYDNHLLKKLENYNKASLMDTYSYTYDDAHNQLSKSEVINGTNYGTTNYTYDKLNRLTKVAEPGGKITEYTYDKAGNRETETVASGSTRTLTTYTYNEQNRLTSTVSQENDVRTTTKYGYDNNGNLTSKLASQIKKIDPLKPPEAHFGMFIAGQEKDGATMFAQGIAGFAQYFEYDVFNQMIKSSTGTSSGEYTYYGDGQRATATTNSKTSRFIYEESQVTLELDSKGNQSARNIYGNNLVTRNADGQSVYYMYNGHSDVTALLKTDGTIMATYQYDAFGNALEGTATKENLKSIENPYTYGGYRFDDESGLYYLNARYYDPATARFMSEDTYRGDPNDPLSLNLYTYCLNNPIRYTDPTGHAVTDWDKQHITNKNDRNKLEDINKQVIEKYNQRDQYANNINLTYSARQGYIDAINRDILNLHDNAEAVRDKYRADNEYSDGMGNTLRSDTPNVMRGQKSTNDVNEAPKNSNIASGLSAGSTLSINYSIYLATYQRTNNYNENLALFPNADEAIYSLQLLKNEAIKRGNFDLAEKCDERIDYYCKYGSVEGITDNIIEYVKGELYNTLDAASSIPEIGPAFGGISKIFKTSRIVDGAEDLVKVGKLENVVNGTVKTLFKNGEMFESKIITKDGIEIGGLADVGINGKTLTLKDVSVYSNKGDIPNAVGARDIFTWQNEIAQQAKDQGFDTLIIKGIRATNSTSANPGKVVEYTIDLTKLK